MGEATLTASGIARLANVGRAAVSNWRRRYADFPEPVGGTPASPSFDAREVERWLSRHNRLHEVGTDQSAWRHIGSYQPAAEVSDLLALCGARLLTLANGATAGTVPAPRELVTQLDALDPGLARLVAGVVPKRWTPQQSIALSTIDQLAAEQDPETAFEYLHRQFVSSAHSLSGLAGTPDTVAEAMLTIAGSGPVTFDFTAGTGSLLRMAADRALAGGSSTRCYGQEIRSEYALVALLRLWFVHLRARRTGFAAEPPVLHVGDSLLADATPGLAADIVVANFPFGLHDWGNERLPYDPRWTYGLPPRTEPELAWVQHALAHLATDGTAVVLMPPAAASRPAGRRIRAELIRRGALRSVIALPLGLMPPTNVGLHIWVLTQPSKRVGELLMVDATVTPPGRTLADVVGTIWRSYLSSAYTEEPGLHRAVAAIDVLDDQVDLTPQRHLPQADELAADPAQVVTRIKAFDRLMGQVRSSLPAVTATPTGSLRSAPQAEISDLLRSGSVSVHRAVSRSRSSESDTTVVVLTPGDVVAGGPATGSVTRAASDGGGPQVRTDDILIPVVGHSITARVAAADHVGAELGPGVQLMRVDTTLFDPWFVAGVISRTDNARVAGRTLSTVSGTFRIDIRRLAIPVLPLEQQRRYGLAFRRVAEFRAQLDLAAAAGAALARDIGDGLTAGALELLPEGDPEARVRL
ncbi:type II restriction endonuclease subunit M [Asanoa ishikariensis]|uniref:N-6 DNA Methylase n=2 Tax=Asanoa ishikariensis TaxID=137265 RepID=A0A1H3UDT6_9ACTN|nr:type II restriction endonuclease subunit M [Asanoa ishikariensis]SDZ60610.1 N-6 DNA Methylase [Asanoa ishikariensis]